MILKKVLVRKLPPCDIFCNLKPSLKNPLFDKKLSEFISHFNKIVNMNFGQKTPDFLKIKTFNYKKDNTLLHTHDFDKI